MRVTEPSHFTPLMRISIVLTIGILIAKASYGFLDTTLWLVSSIVAWGAASCLCGFRHSQKKTKECLLIYFCLFCTSGLLTSHQMDKMQENIEVVSEDKLSSLDKTLLAAQYFRQKTQKKMRELGINDQDFAVISAMTLGDKTALTKETKDIYSISGASHVLAVSGLHIGIIFQLFVLLMGGRRRSLLTVSLSLIAIWGYVLFIGMPASAVRSAAMISICCFAMAAHKDVISINNLSLAYTSMLLFKPLYLFDISFQMSFIAVFSILLFNPIVKEGFAASGRITKWIWGMLCLSMAAQIGTMPLIAYYFGRISCYSLLTSFIAIPAATLILYLSASAMPLSLFAQIPFLTYIATPLLQFVASCLVCITQACNTALQLTTLLPTASVEGIKINIPQLCLIYLGIVAGYLFLRASRR